MLRGRYGALAREPSESELAFAVVLAALALAGMLFGGVVAAFAENPGLPAGGWAVLKGGGLLLLVIAAGAFLQLKRGTEDLDRPRLERATVLSGAGFLLASGLVAGLAAPAWLRAGTVWTVSVAPVLALAALSALCWLSVVRGRAAIAEPEALPPLPAGKKPAPKPYVPVSVARRSGHAGAVMDADSAEWWRRINGDGSWN